MDTTGYTDINLSWVFDVGFDPYEPPNEQLAMDFSGNGGSTWITVVNFNPLGNFEQVYNMNLTAIDACAGNNPNFQIRFWQDATFAGEYAYVDEVFVQGTN